MEKILEVENLAVGYRRGPVVRGASFSLGRGECLMLMGPNGAGKTTLLRGILGLAKVYSGTVKLATDHVFFLPARSAVDRESMPPITIRDFFGITGKNSEKLIEPLLKEVDLHGVTLDWPSSDLSTGQFQRLLIAWALAQNPELLILDEPTSGVDAAGEKSLYEVIGKRVEQGMATIIVTHDLDLIWRKAKRVVCIGNNHFCIGAPEEVLTQENLEKLYGRKLSIFHAHDR